MACLSNNEVHIKKSQPAPFCNIFRLNFAGTYPTIEELNDKCAQQEQQIAELAAKVKWFEEQFRLSQQKRFGASSEKANPDQLDSSMKQRKKRSLLLKSLL
jgi:uncharacterized coiled-coil protein SlyX